ncbi:hypothetical protein Sste5344_007511 [Sporothrix stenoceras]
MPAVCQDPLAALERDLLAHPSHHHYAHSHHPHPPHAHQQAHLVPPSPSRNNGSSRSPSPVPSPAAQRCMTATNAWTPSLDRRQSWDGQAYKRAMMLQSTELMCGCHPTTTEANEQQPVHHHQHHSEGSTRGIYESDRGFSEVIGSTRMQ